MPAWPPPKRSPFPYEAYERYEALARQRQRQRLDDALSAAQSVQVEVPASSSTGSTSTPTAPSLHPPPSCTETRP
jgi:hypothetical protein